MSKRYRLYQKPLYRFLDLFGMCPADSAHYSEHIALDAVDLSVWRGEKIAIIGRNGAGKSTMLKIITGVVRPTSGEVVVRAKVSNLLQIGSGFHPDFTGRQNVHASLAHQGIIGRAADEVFDEIIEFAEIGEYIDQPMKTYSTGMCSRLMFASSVVVKPEVLVIDEILGVGDAYFAHKSFERMRELCLHGGTTLLLVTHDVYSALNLCDRFVWIDRGRIRFDGGGKPALALYESSIKQQEEDWLRQQNAARFAPAGGLDLVHVLVRTRRGFAVPSPVALDMLQLDFSEGGGTTLNVAEGADGWDLLSEGNLDDLETIMGRRCRALKTKGSIYHKAEWLVRLPRGVTIRAVRARWHYTGAEPIDVRVFTKDRVLIANGTLPPGGGWSEEVFEASSAPGKELDLQQQTDYGTGALRIVEIQFLDGDGRQIVEATHGASMTVRIRVEMPSLLADRRVTFVLGFARQGSPYSVYVYDPALALPVADACVIDVKIDPIRLGSGQWYVNVAVGKPNMLDQASATYFALDPGWYHLVATRIEFRVASLTAFDTSGCFTTHPAALEVTPWQPEVVHDETPERAAV